LIITMLNRYVTALYRMVEARQHSDRSTIAQAAGIAPFLISEYMDATDQLGPALIERAIHELRMAERTIKSTSTPPLLVLERMISRIFAA
jgi:DNA polymerase III delta subunit